MPCAKVSYSVEKDYVDDSKSILAEIKGEDIDITSDSHNDEDELEMSGQDPKLGLKYWKLRARKLTPHLVNVAEINAQQK